MSICARRNRQVRTCLLANKTGCDKSKVLTALLNYDNHICIYCTDHICYKLTNMIILLITILLFITCFYAVTSDDECEFNKTMNKWLIYYGIYDLCFGIILMSINHMYTYRVNLPKSFFNIHTLFIIVPNIITLVIMASMGDLNLHRNDCDYTKYYFYSCHWIIYYTITFIICYVGIRLYFNKTCEQIDAVHIEYQRPRRYPIPHRVPLPYPLQNNINIIATDTNTFYECNICFENKKMYALKCKHTFCYDCIMKWNNDGNSYCMMCRQPNYIIIEYSI